jgi:hypothetical protein
MPADASQAAPASPSPVVDEAAIRAEIAALRDAPYDLNESQDDRLAKTEALWKKLYPPEPAASAPATTTVAADPPRLADVPALRAELDTVNPGSPRFKELMQQMEDAYRAAYPENVEQDAASAVSLEVAPISSDVTDDDGMPYQYDKTALAELHTRADDVALAVGKSAAEVRQDFTMWSKVAAAQLAQGTGPTMEECYRELDRRFGADAADAMVADAVALLDRLSKPSRAAFDKWADVTKMTNHAAFVEYLAHLKRGG